MASAPSSSGPLSSNNPSIVEPVPPPSPPPSPPLPPPARGPTPRGWIGRAIDWIEPVRNPASVIYGVLAVGALLAAESGRHESYAVTLGSVLIALCLYWLAHAYADVLGHRLQTQERLHAKALWRGPVRGGGGPPGAAGPP